MMIYQAWVLSTVDCFLEYLTYNDDVPRLGIADCWLFLWVHWWCTRLWYCRLLIVSLSTWRAIIMYQALVLPTVNCFLEYMTYNDNVPGFGTADCRLFPWVHDVQWWCTRLWYCRLLFPCAHDVQWWCTTLWYCRLLTVFLSTWRTMMMYQALVMPTVDCFLAYKTYNDDVPGFGIADS